LNKVSSVTSIREYTHKRRDILIMGDLPDIEIEPDLSSASNMMNNYNSNNDLKKSAVLR
jgi:hypothetical protein